MFFFSFHENCTNRSGMNILSTFFFSKYVQRLRCQSICLLSILRLFRLWWLLGIPLITILLEEWMWNTLVPVGQRFLTFFCNRPRLLDRPVCPLFCRYSGWLIFMFDVVSLELILVVFKCGRFWFLKWGFEGMGLGSLHSSCMYAQFDVISSTFSCVS